MLSRLLIHSTKIRIAQNKSPRVAHYEGWFWWGSALRRCKEAFPHRPTLLHMSAAERILATRHDERYDAFQLGRGTPVLQKHLRHG